jgi:hypothetical protein
MRSRRSLSQLTCLVISSLAAGACPTPQNGTESSSDSTTEPQTSDSSTTADCPVGSESCPCTGGGVCDPGLVCSPAKICVPEGGSTTIDPSTSTTMNVSSTTSTTDDTTTSEPGECDPAEGLLSLTCPQIDEDRPFCVEPGVCGDCTALPPDGCATLDADKPICNPSDGKCVECTVDDQALCGDDTPACNPDSNACEGCFKHSHCPDSACDLIARKCMPTDRVLHVRLGLPGDPDNVCTDKIGTGGSEQNPYCFVDYAIMHAQKDGFTSGWTFKFLKTSWSESYHPGVTLVGDNQTDLRYAFVHEPEQYIGDYNMSFRDVGVLFNAGIGITAYIDHFFFESINPPADAAGVQCQQGGRIFLDDSYVHGARGPGVKSIGCEVWVRNSVIYKGWTEGIDVTDGKLHLINSYVTQNSFFTEKRGGGIAATNSSLDILYSAILNNNNEAMKGGDSIHCRDLQVVGVVRNSVIGRVPMGNNPSIECSPDSLTVITSVHDSDAFAQDNTKLAGETILDYFQPDWVTGAYPITTDVKKKAAAIAGLKDKAIWKKGDPWVDFDGDARHTVDGEADFAGADVPTP